MENSLIKKIEELLLSDKEYNQDEIDLNSFIEVVNHIKNEANCKYREILKKCNSILSNNFAFFNYEIKKIALDDKITLTVNKELKCFNVIINKETFLLETEMRNGDLFGTILKAKLQELVNYYEIFSCLNKLNLKFKYDALNVVIDKIGIEIFMYKSPNWITMGKAFSLKYLFEDAKMVYLIDAIDLEKKLKGQEKLLLSKIRFNSGLLPRPLKEKQLYYKEDDNKSFKTKLAFLKGIIKAIFKK